MLSAARDPDRELTYGDLRMYKADGPGGVAALAEGFREVANRLKQMQPTTPSLPQVSGNDLDTVNELVAICRYLLNSLGEDPSQHLAQL